MVAFTSDGCTIATLHEGTEHEVRVVVDRIVRGYIRRFRAEFIRARDDAVMFDVDERILEPEPSVPVMEALLATFGAGIQAGERAGRRSGKAEIQAEMRAALGLGDVFTFDEGAAALMGKGVTDIPLMKASFKAMGG